MRTIKILLVAGMALMLTLAAFGNITMSDGGFGAVQGAVGMQTTYQHPNAMWRAIESPVLIWMAFGLIIACEIAAAVLCWIGAYRMWQGRASTELFEAAKAKAVMGLGVAACLYFIGFLVIAQEYFLMWQSTQLNVLPDAFRIFASAVLIALWLNTDD
jgi:predicted small integral membrane protein